MRRARLPRHLLANHERCHRLDGFAATLGAHFDAPVYLCGSALLDENAEPRDWDVRVLLPDDDFARRFGPVDEWAAEGTSGAWTTLRQRWSDECVRWWRKGCAATRLPLDVQIYPASWARREFRGCLALRLGPVPVGSAA